MERGHSLEREALDVFSEMTGKKVKEKDEVWVSDKNEYIALSPDGEISATEATEVKCLSSARHLQAYFEKKVPSDYEEQSVQYFIVNEKLKKLYFIFYDPRIAAKPLHYLVIERKDVEEKIKLYEAQQIDDLKAMDEMIMQLTKF